MKIIGNVQTATKFYVIDSNGSIKWVPSLEIAKSYVLNPNLVEWYNKDIYATNEKVVQDKDGKIKLASEVENPIPNIKTIRTAFKDFKEQTENYINTVLQDFATEYDYDNIISMVSYKNSNVEKYKNDANKAIQFRDNIWTYHYTIINELENKINKGLVDNIDFSIHYTEYLKNFPKQ